MERPSRGDTPTRQQPMKQVRTEYSLKGANLHGRSFYHRLINTIFACSHHPGGFFVAQNNYLETLKLEERTNNDTKEPVDKSGGNPAAATFGAIASTGAYSSKILTHGCLTVMTAAAPQIDHAVIQRG